MHVNGSSLANKKNLGTLISNDIVTDKNPTKICQINRRSC